jgi:CheY-like chemotaxis protein
MARKEKKVRIFSALEVANICGVVNQTAINWIKNHYLKAFVTPGGQYRVYTEDLYEFLKSRGMRIPDELKEMLEDNSEWQRVLIVDDDQDFNNMMKKSFTLKLPEFMVLQAFDGFEAGRLIAEWTPGFILLDISLPGLNGHDLCKRIKSDPGLGNPVILAVSGLNDPVQEKAILREGADSFWAKPFDPQRMVEAIQQIADSRTRKRSPA